MEAGSRTYGGTVWGGGGGGGEKDEDGGGAKVVDPLPVRSVVGGTKFLEVGLGGGGLRFGFSLAVRCWHTRGAASRQDG